MEKKYWEEGAVFARGVLVDSIGEILLKSSIRQKYWGEGAVLAWGVLVKSTWRNTFKE